MQAAEGQRITVLLLRHTEALLHLPGWKYRRTCYLKPGGAWL
jgi:hypothetical protein